MPKTILWTIALSTLLFTSVVGVQGQEKKATITGWPPYTFGSDSPTVMQANNTLKRGCVLNGQRVNEKAGEFCVQGTVDAPIQDQPLRATLFLLFLQDRLESVWLMWTFDSAMSRREAAGKLESELRANYAAELWLGHKDTPPDMRRTMGVLLGLSRPDDVTISLNIWRDSQNNGILVVDAWGQPNLLLMYLSSKAAGATLQGPPPPAKY